MRPGAKVLGVAGADEWIEVTIKVRRKKALPAAGGKGVKTLSLTALEEQYGANPADMEKVVTVLTALGVIIHLMPGQGLGVR